MNKFIICALLVSAALASTEVVLTNACQCSQLVYSTDCTTAGAYCSWANNTCSQTACTSLSQTNCVASNYCSYTSGACTSFSECTSLSGTNAAACSSQNARCTWSSGSNCETYKAADTSCSDYTTAQACALGKANNSYCYWNASATTPTCTQLTNCDQLGANCGDAAAAYMFVCAVSGGNCAAASCASFTDANTCKMYTSLNSVSTVNLCSYSGTTCADTNISSLTATQCFTDTLGTYYWNSNESTGTGLCTKCYGALLGFIMAILLLLA